MLVLLALNKQQVTGCSIQPLLDCLPARHDLTKQAIKALAMVVFGQMTQLMQDDVINTVARRFNHMSGAPQQ